ncbi:DNA fragmentation factor subunit beta-like [Petromyzon marinus]|uniref:DNAation factor subunit beta-like n=1 Tax=Petromyzon marinus TaxID=7757 RepID=A0AAJ7X0Q0_PETMA|nr:DNA fragmentation factor subunit beta-like [Petromyzon marinus]
MEGESPRMFRVRIPSDAQRFGVVAVSLCQLVTKAAIKLKLAERSVGPLRVCLEEDGTEVVDEEYFSVLDRNTCLVILKRNERWTGVGVHAVSHAMVHFERCTRDVLEIFRKDPNGKYRNILKNFLNSIEDCSERESRQDDPKWFEGVDNRFKHKREEMRYRCKTRMRGYLSDAVAYKKKVPLEHQKRYEELLQLLRNELKTECFNEDYFDRSAAVVVRLCDNNGQFSCQGAYNKQDCQYQHKINPYANWESRIQFSVWNLDHRIEKSREVLPSLKTALEKSNGRQINWRYFYGLLFTRENLKLVDIVCHDKTCHKLKCKKLKFYMQ